MTTKSSKTKSKKGPKVVQKKLAAIAPSFSARQTDTILAALRAYQDPGRSDVLVAADEIASEHGEPLSSSEIDVLCEQINLGPKSQTQVNPLFQSDEELAILDNALSAAEEILRPLLAKSSASEVTAAFKQHVAGHLGVRDVKPRRTRPCERRSQR